MKSISLSKKDTVLLVFLILLLVGVLYYLAYYKPLQADIADMNSQINQLTDEMTASATKIGKMDSMQKELDEIFAEKDNPTEIAPYDNAKAVMNFLNGVLSQSSNYNLSFSDPDIEEGGTVRRRVSLSFSCGSYETAKAILKNLADWDYRCLLGDVTISAGNTGIALKQYIKTDEETETESEKDTEKKNDKKDDKDTEQEPEEPLEPETPAATVSVNATMTFFESTNIQ